MEDNWDKTDIRYSAEAHTYCSAQPSVFSHIELNVYVSTFGYSNSSIKCFLCAAVVAVSYLLSYDKKKCNTAWRGHGFVDEFISVCGNALRCSNAITSIDTDIFPP